MRIKQEKKNHIAKELSKESSLTIRIRQLIALLFLVVGVLWLFVCLKYSGVRLTYRIIGLGGAFYISIALMLFFIKIRSKNAVNILALLAILNLGYISIEIIMYSYMCFTRTSYHVRMFNKPCAKFDRVRGYRWIGDSARIFFIAKGKIIYDQRFHINKQGWISTKDYTPQKSTPNTTRYIVFGDSFTTAEFLEIPWPDQIEKILNDSSEEKIYEFYSFAVDGGGLSNWHKIFFEEIVTTYEFDGVVFAGFCDDLYRDFAVLHMTEEKGYFKTFVTMPKDINDFERNYINKVTCFWGIGDDVEIDNLISLCKAPFVFELYPMDSYAIRAFILWHDRIVMRKKAEKREQNSRELFGEKIKKLEDIVKWCKEHNKQTILTAIPSREGLLKFEKTEHQKEYELIADSYKMGYYDGYEAFKGLSAKEIRQHWLVYDGHWNLHGSNRFAEHFARYIQEEFSPD